MRHDGHDGDPCEKRQQQDAVEGREPAQASGSDELVVAPYAPSSRCDGEDLSYDGVAPRSDEQRIEDGLSVIPCDVKAIRTAVMRKRNDEGSSSCDARVRHDTPQHL
jgi:hypothetical protein